MGGKPPFTCDGNHYDLTDIVLRTHYNNGCHDDTTRAAVKGLKSAATTRRTELAKQVADDAADYVDHFKTVEPESAPPAVPALAPHIDTVPSVGASRRLRSLMNLGYTPKDLATQVGITVDSVWWLLMAPPNRIQTRTHDLVDEAFTRLRLQPRSSDVRTIEGAAATRARALAELHDWPGPFDWEHIDYPAAAPTPHRTHRDPVALGKAIAEATLDTPTGTPNPATGDLANQLRHTQILLDEAKAGRAFADSELEQVQAKLTEVTAYNDMTLPTLAALEARLQAAIAETLAARAEVARLEQEIEQEAETPPAPSMVAMATSSALANGFTVNGQDSMSISIDPTPEGGIRVTLPLRLLTRQAHQ